MPNKPKLDLERRYFSLEAIAAKTGLEAADIIHAAAHDNFSIYVLADNWEVRAFVKNADTYQWEPASLQVRSFVSGPLRIYPNDLQRFEGNPAAVIQKVMGDTAGYDEHEPDSEWEYRLVGAGVPFASCKLVLMAAAVPIPPSKTDEPTDEPTEKPLLTKERNTLLKIIAALANEAECDLNHATKSSEYLSVLLTQMGAPVSPRGIENHLKAALSIGAKKPKKQ